MHTSKEYEIYLKVQHEILLEDARNQVIDYIELTLDREDWTDEELDRYDYEYLVAEYERREDCNVSFNDTWESVVSDYMEDFEDDESEA